MGFNFCWCPFLYHKSPGLQQVQLQFRITPSELTIIEI